MIGVAFLNEIVFTIVGLSLGWFLGRKFQKGLNYLEKKGIDVSKWRKYTRRSSK